MAGERDDPVESQVTTDADVARAWIEAHGQVPVRESDTVETDGTERTLVEHTVVREATVQSEVVDREILESDLVGADLLSTAVQYCTVSRTVNPAGDGETVEGFRPGSRDEDPYDVELVVEEEWALTRQLVERVTVESRVAGQDVEDAETSETETVREMVDAEAVARAILEGKLLDKPATDPEPVDVERIQSEFDEDDTIETTLIRRLRIEEELAVRKEITGEIADAETVDTRAVDERVVDSEFLTGDEYDRHVADRVGATSSTEAGDSSESPTENTGPDGRETAVTEPAGAEAPTGSDPVADSEPQAEASVTEASAVTADTTTATGLDNDDEPGVATMPAEEDEGKTVVNPDGDAVGMVVGVDDNQIHVDPNPSTTDRIRTALGWGDIDEESYTVGWDDIVRIEGDRVVVADSDGPRDREQ